MLYQSLRETVNSKSTLIPYSDSVFKYIKNKNKDYYISLYQYTDEHKKLVDESGSVKGIRNTTTDRIYLDFDDKQNIENARKDALTVADRLVNNLGIDPENIQAYFTGSKGFAIEFKIDKRINSDEFKAVVYNLAGDLETFDTTVSDPNRIIRVPNTQHQATGYFKIPLFLYQIDELDIDQIKEMAKEPKEEFVDLKPVTLPDNYFKFKEKEVVKNTDYKLDLTKKSSQWRNCKWSLLQGNFKAGERHNALLVIAATARGLGFDKDTTYYLCKSALKKQAALTGQEEFPKEELYKNIIEDSIFKDGWEGGQYSCQKPGWLRDYCKSLGDYACKSHTDDEPYVKLEDMSSMFCNYAENFEQNIIKCGIKGLDENVILCASTLNGLLGQPGAGKTSFALNYLRNTSLNGISSTFFSLDMGMPIVFAKLVQKKTGMEFKEVLDLFKTNKKKAQEIQAILREEYKNVGFNFKNGLTVADMRNIILEQEQQTGKEVKLVIIDYLERIAGGPSSDSITNTGVIANQLTDLANGLNKCVLLLLQTQKHSTPDISDPLLSLKGVKGSSIVEQSCSSILTLWRDGYNPKTVENDKYISFAIVKNRFGSLWTDDFHWNGRTGDIRDLAEEERGDLALFRKLKAEARSAQDSEWK